MTHFDYLVLTLIAIFSFWGLWKGFVKEIISLAGLFAGFYFASQYDSSLASFLTFYDNQQVKVILFFILIFVFVLFLTAMISKILNKLIKAANIGFFNHILGFIFGGIKGILIAYLFLYLSRLIPLIHFIDEQNSFLIPYLDQIFSILNGLISNPNLSEVQYDFA